jgi:hypothetical protein
VGLPSQVVESIFKILVQHRALALENIVFFEGHSIGTIKLEAYSALAPEFVAALANLQDVVELDVSRCTDLNDEALAALVTNKNAAALKSLRVLKLDGCVLLSDTRYVATCPS